MQTIRRSQIVWGSRVRDDKDVSLLADAIELVGLICPLILSPLPDEKFLLEDGGRRLRALEMVYGDADFTLTHGATGSPGVPGYVLASEVSSEERAKWVELYANLFRKDFTWQEQVELIGAIYDKSVAAANAQGKTVTYAALGQILGGYGHSDVNAALQVRKKLKSNPEIFSGCETLIGAYKALLAWNAQQATKILASRVTAPAPASVATAAPQSSSSPEAPTFIYPFSSQFRQGNSIDFLESEDSPVFDHIICDPDFAISPEILASGANTNFAFTASGVAQDNIESSLNDIRRFLTAAYAKCRGYLIMWYDLDHHEKLQSWARGAGWRVQRWPIIWHKTDHRSNGAPEHNFCKNIEYAMVMAKPSATLAEIQLSSVIALPSGQTTKTFNHPFSKPPALWRRLYSAVTTPGQTVFDPFMGAGSAPVAAIEHGLTPYGMELSSDHFANATLNIRTAITAKYGQSTIIA